MKSDMEVLHEYIIKTDKDFYCALSDGEKILYFMQVRDTIGFNKYLISYRIKEMFSPFLLGIIKKIDDVIKKFRRNTQYSNYKKLLAEERNKAIDDFMTKLLDHCMQQTNECYKLECPFCTDDCDIVNIAKQLKK